MLSKQKKFILQENDIPTQWYNIQADMVNKPLPPLNPKTKQPVTAEDLSHIFSLECSKQELDPTGSSLCAGESLGHTGTYLFQKRECKPAWLTQTQLGSCPMLLLQARRHHERHHRDGCRTMGSSLELCGKNLWIRSCRVPSEDFDATKALPQ